MKITLVAGGTGSQNMQKALVHFGKIPFTFSILINCYDNGKSTGWIRKFFEDRILGPSDLRKNQLLRHLLIHGKTKLYQLLKQRFSAHSLPEIQEEVFGLSEQICSWVSPEYVIILKSIRDRFLDTLEKKNLQSLTDFSYANVIYGYLAYILTSMSAAGKFIAGLLDIPTDAVILNSDENFFLQAITTSNYQIEDEGDIVNWDNPDDKIKDIYLEDKDGHIGVPELSETAASLLLNSDLIILSPGTQYSSLIPTYASKNFNDFMKHSRAAKYLIMNNVEDKDMKGVNSLELLEIVSHYLDLSRLSNLTVVYNENAQDSMKVIDQRFNYIKGNLSSSSSKNHDGKKLIKLIFSHFYSNNLTANTDFQPSFR